MTRIYVTGCGVFVPGGKSLIEFWDTLINGKSQIGLITSFDSSDLPTHIGAEVRDYDPNEYFEPKEVRRSDRYAQFAILAAREAISNASLDLFDPSKTETVVVYEGSCLGPTGWFLSQHAIFMEGGYKRANPLTAVIGFPGSASAQIATMYHLSHRVSAVTGGCVASILALDAAINALRLGQADIALVLGAEAPLFPAILASFSTVDILSRRNSDPTTACRPFDMLRDGTVLGEGAAALVLETEASVMRRGVSPCAEIRSVAVTCDHYHITAPDPSGKQISRAMELALREAGLDSNRIDYFNAHGTATRLNDVVEATAIKRTFGTRAEHLPVTSIKGTIGHLLGACGIVELVASILSMRYHKIPPTANYLNSDDAITLNVVAPFSLDRRIQNVISNNYSFGGKNTTVILSAFDDDRGLL